MNDTTYAIAGFTVGVLGTLALRGTISHFYNVAKAAGSSLGNLKMVIVMRTDLPMTNGKIASQAAHAAVSCYKAASDSNPSLLKAWELLGQPKIVVRTNSDKELVTLSEKAKRMGVINVLIRDAGRTQIPGGSVTCLGIGPDKASVIDSISGHLRLL
ncbi:unnamed protein product [Bemisia tabaci]|uniref:peptidyl-tRNA hydrolase n=1 Tax=Bemisia tabaci TaxID=7038 RepID=A0A9P0ADK3_BEMTA|nr:unnamed protein product [Bemisia tabaci]